MPRRKLTDEEKQIKKEYKESPEGQEFAGLKADIKQLTTNASHLSDEGKSEAKKIIRAYKAYRTAEINSKYGKLSTATLQAKADRKIAALESKIAALKAKKDANDFDTSEIVNRRKQRLVQTIGTSSVNLGIEVQ